MKRALTISAVIMLTLPSVASARDPALVRAAWKVSNAYASTKNRLRNWKMGLKYDADAKFRKAKGNVGLQLTRLALAVKRVPKPFRQHVLGELKKAVGTGAILGIWPTVELKKQQLRFVVKWNNEGILETRAVVVPRKGKESVRYSLDTRPFRDPAAFSGEIRLLRRLDGGGFVETLFGTNNPRGADGQPQSLYFLHRAGQRAAISEDRMKELK